MSPRRLRFNIRQLGKTLLAVYVILALVSAVFYMLSTRPRGMEYRSLTVDSAPRMRALQQREDVVKDREDYLAKLEKLEKDLDWLRKEVLSKKRLRMIEAQLEVDKICKRFGISWDQVNYDNDSLEEEGLERFGMVVPLEGGYQNLRSFVQAVENSDKFLVVERVALAQGKEGGVRLQLNITLATYFDAPEDPKTRASS